MAKPSAKGKHAHVDKYGAQAAQHKAELARDQNRWAEERVDIVDPPTEKRRRKRSAQPANSTD